MGRWWKLIIFRISASVCQFYSVSCMFPVAVDCWWYHDVIMDKSWWICQGLTSCLIRNLYCLSFITTFFVSWIHPVLKRHCWYIIETISGHWGSNMQFIWNIVMFRCFMEGFSDHYEIISVNSLQNPVALIIRDQYVLSLNQPEKRGFLDGTDGIFSVSLQMLMFWLIIRMFQWWGNDEGSQHIMF